MTLGMLELMADFILITGLMVVGAWLESIGGKRDLMDEFLTPLPLGLAGAILAFAGRSMP